MSATTYGAVEARPSETIDGTNDRADDEEQPLLHRKVRARASAARLNRHMNADVSRHWADAILLLCYMITGLLDSSSTCIWGAFVSMQTGNTVYIGLGLASPHESTRWIKSSVSVTSFSVGSFLVSRFHRHFSPARRWVLCASYTLQTLLIAGAAIIVTLYPPADKESIGWNTLVPIALVASTSASQTITSRALGYNSLTSVVLTSIYCDLFSDPRLLADNNVERNRRCAAPLLLLLGAFMGGMFAKSELGISGALWTAVAMKVGIVLAWATWPGEARDEEAD